MGCGLMATMVATQCVWNNNSTTDPTGAMFIPYTGIMSTGDYEKFRAKLKLEDISTDIEVSRGYALSNDGITWDAPVIYDTAAWLSTAGFDYATGFTTMPTTKRFIQLGILAKNDSGTPGGIRQMRVTQWLELVKN